MDAANIDAFFRKWLRAISGRRVQAGANPSNKKSQAAYVVNHTRLRG
jgi:hypothetical protein